MKVGEVKLDKVAVLLSDNKKYHLQKKYRINQDTRSIHIEIYWQYSHLDIIILGFCFFLF